MKQKKHHLSRNSVKFIVLISVIFSSYLFGQTELTDIEIPDNQQAYSLSTSLQQKLLTDMVWVEGGVFKMGTNNEKAQNRSKPEHQVTLDDFYIAKTEVTQELFQAVMKWNTSYFQCKNCPMNNISWMNMQLFIERLNIATGKKFRLPTEAEWAFAAKGGIKSENYTYSGSNNIEEVAWYAGNAERRSHPVAQKKPNELGLYDMTGNMWEFCQDDMSRKLYTKKPRVNPVFISTTNVKQKSMKVLRGGGYEFEPHESFIYVRDGATSNVRMPDIGFRLAMDKN